MNGVKRADTGDVDPLLKEVRFAELPSDSTDDIAAQPQTYIRTLKGKDGSSEVDVMVEVGPNQFVNLKFAVAFGLITRRVASAISEVRLSPAAAVS
jgi:hypothetical protein